MGVKYKWYDNRHNNHPVAVIKRVSGPHYAGLKCIKCNTWLKWLSKQEYTVLRQEQQ